MSTVLQPPTKKTDIRLPKSMQCLFRPKRYKVFPHGRGAATSWSVARALLLLGAKKKMRILCARETQLSILDSVHRVLADQIQLLGLASIYKIQKSLISCRNGSDFIFAGIRTDPNKIKSTEGVDICWVEEAEKVSEKSWQILIPTIRKDGSEIWITFNPDEETDPTSLRFLLRPPPPSEAIIKHLTWEDNPWFPPTLRKEMEYDYRVDAEAAAHTWGGRFRKGGAAQIFKGKYVVESFEAEELNKAGETVPKIGWLGPYYGADWGFSSDPDTLVKLWVNGDRLFIEHEAYEVGVELNDIPDLWSNVPGSKRHTIRADNSRPETISHVSTNYGYDVQAAEKWPGSVEDGIRWLRHHEKIVIHPRCKHAEAEARLYKYKVDPLTGDVLPIIVDKHNHIWDAVRYAMQPAICTPVEELTVVYEEPEVSFNPEMDEFEMRNGL